MEIKKTKLIYIVNARIPTEKAHGYQICKMCEEFSNIGVEVELWTPTRDNHIQEEAFSFYGIKNNFRVRKIKSFDFLRFKKFLGRLTFWLNSLLFLIKLAVKKIDKEIVIYTRNPEIAWWFSFRKYKTVFEAHNWPRSKIRLYAFLLRNTDKIICNSRGTERELEKRNFKNTIVAPNGVDLEKFNISDNEVRLKKEFNLPLNKKIVMYIGHLYTWKGIKIIIDAAKLLISQKDIVFVLVGGTDIDLEEHSQMIRREELSNIILSGYQRKDKMPKYLKCADILLLPNIPLSKESIEYTSPIKMFEYMASKKPIIASDLPSIREILSDDNCVFCKPGNVQSLADKISLLIFDQELGRKKAEQAYIDVQKYTWSKRAKNVLKFIE